MWGLGILILGTGALQVSQDPSEAWVTVGGSVALGCQVLTAGPWDLLRLEWVKDTERKGDDAGHYVCRVTLEIPRHDTATGNGTLLSVSTASDGGHQAGLVWGLVGALGGTALLLGLAFLGHWCWRRNSDTGIYMNVLPASAQPPRKLWPPPW